MAEQTQNNSNDAKCNIGIYPYDCIRLELKDLLFRFGEIGKDFVPLVIEWGTKGPIFKDWQSLSWEKLISQPLENKGGVYIAAGTYLKLITGGKRNVGIRIGPAWGNLANFDIDVPDRTITDTLLHFCPELADTLWTKGSSQSGHSVWFRLSSDWPGWGLCWNGIKVPEIKGRPKKDKKTGEIKENENALELRTQNGIQSVIYGLHENKQDHYCVVNDKPIIELSWKQFEKIIKGTTELGWSGWPAAASGRTSRAEGRWTNSPLGFAGNLEKRLQVIEELDYEILDVEAGGRNRIKVRCPNVDNHNTAEKEGEAIIFPGTDERGEVAFHCLHTTCKTKDETLGSSFNQRETVKLQQAFVAKECIYFRPGYARLNETYDDGYGRMRATGEFFNLNLSVARWKPGWDKPVLMNQARIHRHLNELGIRIMHHIQGGKKIGHMDFSGAPANAFLDQPDLIQSTLGEIQFVSQGKLPWWNKSLKSSGIMQYGYNPELKCLCLSQEELQPMTGKQGLEFLDQCLLCLWHYETPEDKSRALCMILSIAQNLGNWYEGRGAFHLVTADRHQAGKTLLIQCLGAVYGVEIKEQDQEEKGIGAIRERFNKTVDEGSAAFLVDNIEGVFESTLFEMLATSTSTYDFRLAYGKLKTANIDRMTFLLTGNEGFQTRNAMASRLNIIKILYQPHANFEVKGESVLSVIQANSLFYRSAVSAVLLEYAKIGAPRKKLEDKGCDFRFADYTRFNNGLLEFYGWPLLTTGLSKRQQRAVDPDIIFAEKLFPELEELGALDKVLIPQTIARYLSEESDLVPPKCEGKRLTESIIAGRISKLLRGLPPVKKGEINQFGPGFCRIIQNKKTHAFSFVISKNENPPTNPDAFEYDN